MPNQSSKTRAVAFRATVGVYAILERRAVKLNLNVNKYVKQLLDRDATRKR